MFENGFVTALAATLVILLLISLSWIVAETLKRYRVQVRFGPRSQQSRAGMLRHAFVKACLRYVEVCLIDPFERSGLRQRINSLQQRRRQVTGGGLSDSRSGD